MKTTNVASLIAVLGGERVLADEAVVRAFARLWNALVHGQIGFMRGAPEGIDMAARAIVDAGLCRLPQVAPISLKEEISRAEENEEGGAMPPRAGRADPKIFALRHNLGQTWLQDHIVRGPVHPRAHAERMAIEASSAWKELHQRLNETLKRNFPKGGGAFRVELHVLQCVNDMLLAWFLGARLDDDLVVTSQRAALINLIPDCLVYGREVPHANVWVVIYA